MRNSFVFYGSWWEAIKNLPRDVQGDVLTAIIEYGLTGVTTGQLKPIAKAMLAMAKTQIDINNQRFENGKKGGRKKTSSNQTETNPKPSSNQTETNPKPNVNVNVNDNDNDYIPPYNIPPLRDDEEETPPLAPVTTGQIPLEEFRRRIAENPVTNPTNEELRRGLGLGGDSETLEKWLDEYIDAQTASGNTANYFAEYRRHFANWARIKKKNTPGNGTNEEPRPRYYKPL